MCSKDTVLRQVSLNCDYICIFKNLRDLSCISYFARQLTPKKGEILSKIYGDCCVEPFGYLFIDIHQKSRRLLKFRTDIFNFNDDSSFKFPVLYT